MRSKLPSKRGTRLASGATSRKPTRFASASARRASYWKTAPAGPAGARSRRLSGFERVQSSLHVELRRDPRPRDPHLDLPLAEPREAVADLVHGRVVAMGR